MSGEGGRYDKHGEEVEHHQDHAVAMGRGREPGLTPDKVKGHNVVLFASAEGV